jgi:Erv1 / Alr family
MKPEQWGPPIWRLFHCLSVYLRPDSFPIVGRNLFFYIQRICQYLPCPDCSEHAKRFFSRVLPSTLRSKDDLVHMLFCFHNSVNRRKGKPILPTTQLLDQYQKSMVPIPVLVNSFLTVYHTKGNMSQLNESFQRSMVIKEFKKWLLQNLSHFALPSTSTSTSTPTPTSTSTPTPTTTK